MRRRSRRGEEASVVPPGFEVGRHVWCLVGGAFVPGQVVLVRPPDVHISCAVGGSMETVVKRSDSAALRRFDVRHEAMWHAVKFRELRAIGVAMAHERTSWEEEKAQAGRGDQIEALARLRRDEHRVRRERERAAARERRRPLLPDIWRRLCHRVRLLDEIRVLVLAAKDRKFWARARQLAAARLVLGLFRSLGAGRALRRELRPLKVVLELRKLRSESEAALSGLSLEELLGRRAAQETKAGLAAEVRNSQIARRKRDFYAEAEGGAEQRKEHLKVL